MTKKLVRKPIRGRVSWRIYKAYNGIWMPVTQCKSKILAESMLGNLKKAQPERKFKLLPPLFDQGGGSEQVYQCS